MDPQGLRHIPKSEFRKRRAYYLLVKQAMNPDGEEVAPGVIKTEYGEKLDPSAKIVG